MRSLVRETRLSPRALISPIFLVPGADRRQPLEALAGHDRLSPDLAVDHARRLAELGVGGVLLFGVPDEKDDVGHGAADPAGPVPETLRRLREADLPLVLMADVCLCEYTTHGHCGALDGHRIDNDRSLPLLAAAARPSSCCAAAPASGRTARGGPALLASCVPTRRSGPCGATWTPGFDASTRARSTHWCWRRPASTGWAWATGSTSAWTRA